MDRSKYKYFVGIDTGVKTGYALWSRDERKLLMVATTQLHKAILEVKRLHDVAPVFVRVEDARLRKWFGEEKGRDQLQGAGSVKRDAKIWEDFLTDLGIAFEMVPPKNNKTKTDDKYFKKLTGYDGRTSSHARDAAMLVFGL